MSKKVWILLLAVSAVGAGVVFYNKDNNTDVKTSADIKEESADKENNVIIKVNITDLHSEILKLIYEGDRTIAGISPDSAKKELDRRSSDSQIIKEIEPNVHELPFDILVLISKSAANVAGISPRQAYNEISMRYMSLDKDDVTFSDMLFIYRNYDEQKAINKWADNEDVEEIEKFIKEHADADPSSFAAFAYGVRHLKTNRDEALSYLKKFAENVNPSYAGSIEESEKQSLEALIKDINDLK